MLQVGRFHTREAHWRSELVQCYLRFGFAALALIMFVSLDYYKIGRFDHSLIGFVTWYVVWDICYYLFVRFNPSLLINTRFYLPLVIDIGVTTWVMYLAGELSSTGVALFLWYIIGYGMRFGILAAVVATVLTTLCWLTLANISSYWNQHFLHVIGWQVAFLVIPLYYFILVKQLQLTRRKLQIALSHAERLANYDQLTGLANRTHFNLLVDKLLAGIKPVAVMLIDLDGFKMVNDHYGHETGDRLLMQMAKKLKAECPSECVIGRLGGDEFVLASVVQDEQEIRHIANSILRIVRDIGLDFGHVTASVGISWSCRDGGNLSELKRRADEAMYMAKRKGKNKYQFASDFTTRC